MTRRLRFWHDVLDWFDRTFMQPAKDTWQRARRGTA